MGRFEIVSKDPHIILDVTHNEESAFYLAQNIAKIFKKNETMLILSILKDKEISKILEKLQDCSDSAIFLGIDNKRGLKENKMYEIGKDYFKNSYIAEGIDEALKMAFKNRKKAYIICGSFYLVKEYFNRG